MPIIDLPDALEFAAKVLRNASIKAHLKRFAFQLLDEEATGGPYPRRIKRAFAARRIANQFQKIHSGSVFNQFMQAKYNNVDDDVILPTLNSFYITDNIGNGLYAIPKYLFGSKFQQSLTKDLESSNELDAQFNDVFQGTQTSREGKKDEFIKIVCQFESENWMSLLSEVIKPQLIRNWISFNPFRQELELKKVGESIFFLGEDSQSTWTDEEGAPKGHFYISRRDSFRRWTPNSADLTDFKTNKRPELDAILFANGLRNIATQINGEFSNDVEHISISTINLLRVEWPLEY